MIDAESRGAVHGVAWGTFAGIARMAATFAVWFFLTPLMIRSLGVEQYGLWSLLFSLVGFLSLLDLGTGAGVVRTVAASRGATDTGARDEELSTYVAASLVLSGVGILGLALMHAFVIDALGVPSELRTTALTGLWIVGLRSFVLAVPLGLPRGILFGENRFVAVNVVQTVATVITALLMTAALRAGGTVVMVAAASLAGMLMEHAAYWYLARKSLRSVRLSLRLVSRRALGRAASLGMSQFIIAASGLILLRTDPLIVQIYLGVGAVSLYAVAMKVAENTFLLVKQFVNTLSPLIAEWHAAGRAADLRSLLLRATRIASIPAALIGGVAIGASDAGLRLWLGPSFEPAVAPMRILILAMVLTVPQMVMFSVLTYSDRHTLPARASIGAAVLNLSFSMMLARPFGLVGIALGTLAATAIVDVAYVLRTGARTFGLPFQEFMRRAVWPVWLPMGGIAGTLAVWLSASPCHGIGDLVLRIGVVTLAGAALLYRFALESDERDVLNRNMARLSSIVAPARWRTA